MRSPILNKLFKIIRQPVRYSSTGKNFLIRDLNDSEFNELTQRARREGWNPGIYEYSSVFMAYSKGFKGLFSTDNQLIASLSAVPYDMTSKKGRVIFLGNYILLQTYRKFGIGKFFVNTVLAEFEDEVLLGLNAVKQQVGNYQRKFGFYPYHNIFRYAGILKDQGFKNSFSESEEKIQIIGHETLDIKQLTKYDTGVFSCPRNDLLLNWIKMPESQLFAAIKNNQICGYAVVSKCFNGYKLAPFFAKDKYAAKSLSKAIFSAFTGKPMQIDIPEKNHFAIELATQIGLYKTFETTRMYKGESEQIEHLEKEINQVYALTSLEIG
jgi:hypothetical protein